MTEREHDKAPWPEGRARWNESDKLMRMARAVLDRLRSGGATIPAGRLADAYAEVLVAAEKYWARPDEDLHQQLTDLYDDRRDEPYPA